MTRTPQEKTEQLHRRTVRIMEIQINQKSLLLPDGATVADALAVFGARPPFAVALNGQFVARAQHPERALNAGDKLDIVHPVAGG
jgi:sulfur carrier protein